MVRKKAGKKTKQNRSIRLLAVNRNVLLIKKTRVSMCWTKERDAGTQINQIPRGRNKTMLARFLSCYVAESSERVFANCYTARTLADRGRSAWYTHSFQNIFFPPRCLPFSLYQLFFFIFYPHTPFSFSISPKINHKLRIDNEKRPGSFRPPSGTEAKARSVRQ